MARQRGNHQKDLRQRDLRSCCDELVASPLFAFKRPTTGIFRRKRVSLLLMRWLFFVIAVAINHRSRKSVEALRLPFFLYLPLGVSMVRKNTTGLPLLSEQTLLYFSLFDGFKASMSMDCLHA